MYTKPQLEKYSDATFMQDSIASVAGAVASITVAQPLDVIKTRIQKRDFRYMHEHACFGLAAPGACIELDSAKPSSTDSPPPNNKHSDKTSGTRILLDLIKKEGFGAFFKGLTPKLVVIGPKLVFSFTVAQVGDSGYLFIHGSGACNPSSDTLPSLPPNTTPQQLMGYFESKF